MSFEGLREIFPSKELPTVVSDCRSLLDKFKASGFRTLSVDDVCNDRGGIPEEVLLVPAVPAIHPNVELNGRLSGSAVLLVPLLAFAHDDRSIAYMHNRLGTLDFAAACANNRRAIENIQHTRDILSVDSEGCHLQIELGDNVDVFAPKLKPELSHGEWISIIQFFEIGLVPSDDYGSFNVTGTLACNGVSVAHHLHSHFESGPPAHKIWSMLAQRYSNGEFPLVLEVRDSTMTRILTRDGQDLLPEILPYTDDMMRGNLTEVGFGALAPSDQVDWSINSQLNEPAGGIHLALGAGEEAAHIDFVSPYARISGFN
ncbi:hypothetical protein [Emcibacter nanhaiensis]|uniref:Crocagin biosynthetic protein CgnE/B domain-containing protein n=1 Tax=Emcibacter nanhaiensis TaxID=1505037 RepID=A0A501PTQ9_9PROT|nr:hypothetical protein [Emcibacter nanhaiensis]TPD63111.1 hypothetical protein FIV46_03260 [Emcibacter nanhaiensis]